MKTIGQKLIYSKWINPSDPTTKMLKVKDGDGNAYTLPVPVKPSYTPVKCVVVDKITETRETKGTTRVSYEISLKKPDTKAPIIFMIEEDSPMWNDMEIDA